MALSGLLPDPPTPPNPIQTAGAQTGTNVSTAIANSYLGNVNQSTPQGNLSFDKFADFSYTDPTTGQSFNIPRWQATQTLSPAGQQAFDQTQAAQVNLSELANRSSGQLEGLLGTQFDPNRGAFNASKYLETYPDVMAGARSQGWDPIEYANVHYRIFGQNEGRATGGTPVSPVGDINLYNQVGTPQSSFADAGSLQDTYGSGGAITRGYGPADNFSADRQRVEDAMMQRLNPQLQLENERVRQRLADQGIRASGGGMDAYDAGMDVYNRQANDARFAAIQQAGQEQQRMNEMARNLAVFQNQAQAQAEGQLAARGAFSNAAQQARYEQLANRAQFYNQAQNQMLGRQSAIFNAQNQLRNQGLQEQYQLRQQPINEITALMSGSQVQQPSWINAGRTQIPTTDVAGLINQNFAQQNDIFKTQTGFWGDIIGGTLGAAGNIGKGYMMSDRRVKEEIEPLGSVFGNGKKLPIYEYQFKGDPSETRHTGPMAQDVERLDPSAVKEIGGVKHIKTDRMGSIFGRG